MRIHFLLPALCLFGLLIHAQSNYHPLIEANKTWNVMESGIGGPTFTYSYEVEGDTLINQVPYQVLYRSDEEFPLNWIKHGYIREEDKKVYYSPYHSADTAITPPRMIYDFGAALGDTLLVYSFAGNYEHELVIVISGVDSVMIGNDYRKRLTYDCEWTPGNFWIEGVGSNNGLIEPGFYCYIVCPLIELLCVKEENEIIFQNEYFDDCYIMGIEENLFNTGKFNIYPNPVDDYINVVALSKENSEVKFTIYNSFGRQVIFHLLRNGQTKVFTGNLAGGIYFYTISGNGQKIRQGKLLIR
ncbi:MAG: T9SS type A sorting domain-containing protein [Bacteroidales bacterium]